MTKLILISALFLAPESRASELNALYREPQQTLRAPASAVPEALVKDFVVTAPERAPASVGARAQKAAKAPAATNRRSRLPASIVNGFELRVQYNKLNSMFWVVERESHYDLVFANSAGSKASLGLSTENFKTLHKLALGFKPVETNLAKCKDSSMQLHVVTKGAPERTVTTCVDAKTPDAAKLRDLSQNLAALVR